MELGLGYLERCYRIERSRRSTRDLRNLPRDHELPSLQLASYSCHISEVSIIHKRKAEVDLSQLMNWTVNPLYPGRLYVVYGVPNEK